MAQSAAISLNTDDSITVAPIMRKEILDRINESLDKALLAFRDDPELAFYDEKERLSLKFDKEFLSLDDWGKSKICIYRGCTKNSIVKSHTIQRAGPLLTVAENGHVYTPRVNIVTGKVEVKRVGIGDASTFPGFCSEHERLFEKYEQAGFTSPIDFMLQTYRTVCREIVRNEHLLNSTKKRMDQYRKFRNKKFLEFVKQDLGDSFISELDYSVLSTEFKHDDYRLSVLKDQVKDFKNYLNGFLYKFEKAVLNDVRKTKAQRTSAVVVTIDVEIPVAIAGKGNFQVRTDSKVKDIPVIINVLPDAGKTHISIASFKSNYEYLQMYFDYFTHPIKIINMIEAWMIHGSDHWFLRPSVWEEISENGQAKIINEFLDLTKNIGSECPITVFNKMKRDTIAQIAKIDSLAPDDMVKIIANENLKFSDRLGQ